MRHHQRLLTLLTLGATDTGPVQVGEVAARVFVNRLPRIEVVGDVSNYQYVP